MRNAHGLCGKKIQTPTAPGALGLSRMYATVEEVAAAMNARPHEVDGSVVELDSCLKTRFSKDWCPLHCEKDFCEWHEEDMENHHLRDDFEQYRKTEVIEIMTN